METVIHRKYSWSNEIQSRVHDHEHSFIYPRVSCHNCIMHYIMHDIITCIICAPPFHEYHDPAPPQIVFHKIPYYKV